MPPSVWGECDFHVNWLYVSRIRATHWRLNDDFDINRQCCHLTKTYICACVCLCMCVQAASSEDSSDGILFMHDMIELSKTEAGDGTCSLYLYLLFSHLVTWTQMAVTTTVYFCLALLSILI